MTLTCSQCSEPAAIAPFPMSHATIGSGAATPGLMFSTLVSEPYCAKHSPFQWVTDTSQVQWFPEANASPLTIPTGVLMSTKAAHPTFDSSRLRADGEAAQREIERLRAALADAERGEQMEREHADYLLNENAGLRSEVRELRKIVRVVAEADNSDSSVCYQLCQYSVIWVGLHGEDMEVEHTAPCVVEQARAQLAADGEPREQATQGEVSEP